MDNPIYPCLWFDGQAKEAATFYCSVFPGSKIVEESPLVVLFELRGTKFMALNGGPMFKFNESVSFVINCDTQSEIDRYWELLTKDGEESMCGWLKDRFGVSWQIVPSVLPGLMNDPVKGPRVVQAFLTMGKFDIARLLQAAEEAG